MPLCIDTTSASHRPVIWLPATVLLEEISISAPVEGAEAREPAPSHRTMITAMNFVAEIPFPLLGKPDVSSFHGEIHLSWNSGAKQVVLMFFPDRTPLIHHHQRTLGAASQHDIEEASVDRAAYWLRWLRD